MKASELRIGNLIFDNLGRNIIVSEVRTEHLVFNLSNGNKIKHTLNSFKPIPLNEEWLLKFGFYNSNNEYSLSNVFFYICFKFYKNGNKKLWINSNDVKYLKNEIIFINSVHQLQNLYFALTGEELIINK